MKLHLPKLLRHAVLACVTAVAGVTTTIGTATFTGGLVAVSLAGHQAWAGWDGDTYYLSAEDEDLTPTAAAQGDDVSIMADDIVEYVMTSFTMKNGQSLTIAANPENGKNVQKLTINNLVPTDADNPMNAHITIKADQTLALGKPVLTSANKFAAILVEGTLDLSAIKDFGTEYGEMAQYSKNLSKMEGMGTVKLAQGLHLQSAGVHHADSPDGGGITLSTNFVVGGDEVADYSDTTANNDTADLILQSHAKFGKWRDWDVVSGGSLKVGTNGKGVLNMLSGNRLDICGGSVTAGIIRVGHSGATDNVGAVALSDDGSLTVGNMLVQGRYTNGWDNAVTLLDGTVEFTSQYAVSYASDASADVTLGGTGDEQLKLVAKTDWAISKESSKATSSFTVGNVLVDSANTAGITLTNATVIGAIDNRKTLTLSGTTLFDGAASIMNSGSLTLTGTVNLLDIDSISDGAGFSDGANGFSSAEYWLVKNEGSGTVDVTGLQLQLKGSAIAFNADTTSGVSFTLDPDAYYVNTQVTYDSAEMASITKFVVNPGGVLRTPDTSVLNKVTLQGEGAAVILEKVGGTIETGNNAGYSGNLIIAAGTNVKATHSGKGDDNDKPFGNRFSEDNSKSIILESDASFDFNGLDAYYKYVLRDGATLCNNSTTSRNPTDHATIAQIILEGNATVSGIGNFGLRHRATETKDVLDLAGYTLTKTGSNTFYCYNTEVSAGTLDIQEGIWRVMNGTGWRNVDVRLQNGAQQTWDGKSTDTDIGLKSLTVYSGTSSGNAIMEVGDKVTLSVSGATVADSLLQKNGAGTLVLAGDAELRKGLTITAGEVEFQGATALGGLLTIENNASLAMGESATVTLSSLAGFIAENGVVSIPETNGLVSMVDTDIKIVDNKNADATTNELTTVTYKGKEYTLDGDGSINASAKVYYAVESGDEKIVTVGGSSATDRTNEADEFYVGANGALKIAGNASEAVTAKQVLATTTGNGTLKLATSANLADGDAMSFAGKLSIESGGDLRLGITGEGDANAVLQTIDLSSLSSVELAGGTLSMRAFAGELGVVNVTGAGSVLYSLDTVVENGKKAATTIEKLNLGADLELRARWKTNLIVDKLTGTGKLSFTANWGDSQNRDLSILSVAGYTGNIEIVEKGDNFANVQLTIRAGESLNATQITTCEHSAVALSGAGLYNLGAATALDSKITLTEGWTGMVQITGANVTSSVDVSGLTTNRSTLAINGLTVADGGSLTLGGAVTLDGEVTLAESIVNNSTLTLGSNLKLDLTGMEISQSGQGADVKIITLLTGRQADLAALGMSEAMLSDATKALGTGWQFNADGTITYTANVAPPDTDWVWEGEGDDDAGGVWGSNNTDNWVSDSGSTSAATDVSFTATGAGKVQIDGGVEAKDIYVTEGEYIFTQKEGTTGGITANSMTIRGDSTSVTIENANTIGTTNLKGGTLVLSGTTATTGGAIVLGGGLLKYDGYTGADISSQVSMAEGYTGPVKIEVVDNTSTADVVESVTWTKAAAGTANGGVDSILAKGIVKTGTGNMTMTFQYTGDNTANTYAGSIDVQGGTLVYDARTNDKGVMTVSGGISVAENAAFTVKTNCDEVAQCVTLSGALTGKGTVQLGETGQNGRYYLSGDNSGFEGTIKIVGNDSQGNRSTNLLVFSGENSFGGSATTVELNGRLLNFAGNYSNLLSKIHVASGNNNLLDGSSTTLSSLVFKGALTGNGTDVVFGTREKMKFDITMQGDVSAYQGKLSVGSATTWTLGGEGISSAGAVQATLTGTGTIKIQYNNATTISGKVVGTTVDDIADTLTLEQAGSGTLTVSGVIGGTANVKQSGAGTLVLTAENTTSGTLTIAEGKKVQLGTADAATPATPATPAAWVGTTLDGAGTLEIVNGSLSATTAMSRATGATASIVVNAAAGKAVALGKTGTDLLSSVTLAAGSTLSTTAADAELTLGSAPAQSRAATTGGLESLNLTLTKGNIGADAAGTAMISGADIAIYDANKVTIDLTTDGVIDLLTAHRGDQSIEDRTVVESYLTLTDGTLTCSNEQLQKLGIAGTLMNYGIRLDGVNGGSIVASGEVDGIYFVTGDDKTFPHTVSDYNTLGMYKGTVVKQNQELAIKLAGDTADNTKVTLNNLLGGTGSSLVVTNTSNTGVVTVELSNQAVDVTGVDDPAKIDTTTTMEGSISGNKGTELVKTGVGTLVVNGMLLADELEIKAGTLVLNNAENAVATLNGTGGTLQLGSGSTLAVDGGELTNVTLQAVPVATVAAGTPAAPVLEVNGNLSLLGTSSIDGGIVLDVDEGETLVLAGTTNDVVALTGSGTVAGVSGTVLSLDNAAAATYSGALTGAGTLKVENGGGTFTLKNASTSDWSITNAGKMVVDMTGSDTTPGSFACKALTLAGTSSTEFLLNTDNTGGIQLGSLTTEAGAAITITSTGESGIVLEADNTYVLCEAGSWNLAAGQTVTLQGMAFSRVGSTATLVDDAGKLKLQVAVSKENKYKSLTETKNGEAGAELMWNASMAEVAASPVLKELDTRLNAAAAAGVPQDELLASIAGASTAVLGMAVNNDVDRQLRAIRNRTTTMGVDQGVVNPEMPYYNAWINAEGGNNELRHSGTQGGYKLNSWGGTVGFDADFTPNLTAGLALTAMYGDLTVNGADQAKGDLDTYYVSAFARYCASAWTHTFVATAGLADMSLSRTVAGEEVEGDTNGMSFGLMYEAGRVFALNEDATACLQPILNVAWRHTTVDGYTEKGSDLGLKVDEQTYDSLTVGLGARLQTVVGESLYNRTSIFECRALVKAELGDHQGTSEVTLAGASAKVESAEMGSVGLEAGAGITIPLGDEGSSIFADASIEVYSGYTNVNGTVGYRINF